MGTGNQRRNYLEEINLLKYTGKYPLTMGVFNNIAQRYFKQFYDNYNSDCKRFWFDIQIGEQRFDKKYFSRLNDLVDWINDNVPNDGADFTEHSVCAYPYYIEDQNIRPIMFVNGFNRLMASMSGKGRHRSGTPTFVNMKKEYPDGIEIIQNAFQELLNVSVTALEAVTSPFLGCMWKGRTKKDFFRTPRLFSPIIASKTAIHFNSNSIHNDRYVYDKILGSCRKLVPSDYTNQNNCGYISDFIVAISKSDSADSQVEFFNSSLGYEHRINQILGSREDSSGLIIAKVNFSDNVYAFQVYPLGIDSFILNMPDMVKYDIEIVTEAPFMRQELSSVLGAYSFRTDDYARRLTFCNNPLLRYLKNESTYPATGGKVSFRFRVVDKVTGIVSPLSKSKISRTYNPKRYPPYQFEIEN